MALASLSDSFKEILAGGTGIVMWFQAGDGTMKPGYICIDDDADEVKIATASAATIPFGVVGTKPTLDIDTAHASGLDIPVFILGGASIVHVGHDASTEAAAKGQQFRLSTETAATVESRGYTAKAATYAAANFTQNLDTNFAVIGRSVVYSAAALDTWMTLII